MYQDRMTTLCYGMAGRRLPCGMWEPNYHVLTPTPESEDCRSSNIYVGHTAPPPYVSRNIRMKTKISTKFKNMIYYCSAAWRGLETT